MKLYWAITCQLILILLFIGNLSKGQTRESEKYFVQFTDKKRNSFDPYTYFDINAIERRIDNNYPIYHFTDWPINKAYISKIKGIADTLLSYSRWLNGVTIKTGLHEIELIKSLPFVETVEPLQSTCALTTHLISNQDSARKNDIQNINSYMYEDLSKSHKDLLKKQTERMGGNYFSERDIDGAGIRIAVFDAGFPSVDKHIVFEHIRKNNKILKTKDFLKNKENVYKYNSHGTSVLSCIAGILDGKKIGLATGAEFLLARTESGIFEPYSEEENWLSAAEWADKHGAHIINSSLGYTHNRYFPKEMDGKKSLVARAANIAASKGILVVNAAGNDGDSEWKTIGTPADADSVLSIGGTDPDSDFHIDFSSYGPTADKRLKPNVCAYGLAVVAIPGNSKLSFENAEEKALSKKNTGRISTAYGTSFSSPLVCGFAACAWQSRPTLSNMDIFREIEMSGDLYPYFDYAHGYGIPQAKYFTKRLKSAVKPTFKISVSNNILKVIIEKNTWNNSESETTNNLFYHIEHKAGNLKKYLVLSVYDKNVMEFNITDFEKGSKLRIHYKGYTEEFVF